MRDIKKNNVTSLSADNSSPAKNKKDKRKHKSAQKDKTKPEVGKNLKKQKQDFAAKIEADSGFHFTVDTPGENRDVAKIIARNSEIAEKKQQQTQSAAPIPEEQAEKPNEEKQAEQTATNAAILQQNLNQASEHSALEADNKMAKILAAMSRQFKPDQILIMPWRRAVPFLILGGLCILIQGLSMNAFQNNIALLEGYFHASTIETLWLVSAYMAPYASFTILLIKLRTQFGMRLFTITSLICFLLCCIVSLFIRNYETALVIRFFAGLTTAPISSIGFLYTFEVFTPTRKVTMGISLNMMYMALGMPISRIVGSYIFVDNHIPYFYLLEIGLTCIALAMIYYVHVTPLPQAKVLEKMDFISYPLIALGLGLTAAMMPLGRYYWWQDVEWMGWGFAIAAVALTLALLIELNRKSPMIDIRWLLSADMFHITIVMLTFRLLVSDQTSLLGNYFTLFGLQNENLVTLYLWTIVGTVLGGVICMTLLKPGGGDYLYLIGALIIAIGSFSDSFCTNLTRPQNMYISQMLIGLGTALFMAVSMSKGMTAAFARGKIHAVISFIAIFQFTQSTGGLTGSAFFGTIQDYLEKFHSYILTQHLVLTDPLVAARISAYSHIYSGIMTDSTTLNTIGITTLTKKATLEANILAYNDIFRIYGYIAVTLFCLLAIRVLFKTRHFFLRAEAIAEQNPQQTTKTA